MIYERFGRLDSREGIEKAFKRMDHDKTGKLSAENLWRISQELGEWCERVCIGG